MSEEFMAIIELLESAGQGTIWCFVGYLMYQLIEMLLGIAGIVVVLRTIGYVIKSICDKCVRSGNICKHIRQALKLGCEGSLDDKEYCRIETAVGEMLAERMGK